ncbi:MAG: methylenetetrahydrofolate reductase [NAD(P)H] [Kiloniellales bacterium]
MPPHTSDPDAATTGDGVSASAGLKLSFEFFPPKTPQMEARLWTSIERLAPLRPRFVSVTYGAGGSTREATLNTVRRIHRETTLTPAAHLTCVGARRAEVDAVARGYWQAGIRHIVAIRGDPPAGTGRYRPHPGGYESSVDLVAGLKRIADFELSVGAYPETHPEASSSAAELDYLKRKMDAGATRAITQYFFEAACFLRFLERVRSAGITMPVVPGIMPVNNFAQVARFSAMCGATVPDWLAKLFDGLDDDPPRRHKVATAVGVELCRTLCDEGIDAFHFYTLNRSELVTDICRALGVRARDDGATAAAAPASPV